MGHELIKRKEFQREKIGGSKGTFRESVSSPVGLMKGFCGGVVRGQLRPYSRQAVEGLQCQGKECDLCIVSQMPLREGDLQKTPAAGGLNCVWRSPGGQACL